MIDDKKKKETQCSRPENIELPKLPKYQQTTSSRNRCTEIVHYRRIEGVYSLPASRLTGARRVWDEEDDDDDDDKANYTTIA